jgi:hypothetical protein
MTYEDISVKKPGKSRRNEIKEIGRSLIGAMEQISNEDNSDDLVMSLLKKVKQLLFKNGFELMSETFLPEEINPADRRTTNRLIFNLLEGLNANLWEKFDAVAMKATFIDTIDMALKAPEVSGDLKLHRSRLIEISEQMLEGYQKRAILDLTRASELIE